jgi:hypothetical protein
MSRMLTFFENKFQVLSDVSALARPFQQAATRMYTGLWRVIGSTGSVIDL